MQSPPARRWCKKGAENNETNQDIGLSRGGHNTKIHAVVDALGNPMKLYLTPGNIHDSIAAVEVLSGITLTGSVVLGDKAYGTAAIREYIESVLPIVFHQRATIQIHGNVTSIITKSAM